MEWYGLMYKQIQALDAHGADMMLIVIVNLLLILSIELSPKENIVEFMLPVICGKLS